MIRPTRATLAVGLTLLGASALVGRSFGQQQADPRVQATAGNPAAAARPTAAAAAPAAPSAAMPLLIGSIDVDRVLKDYDKFKVANETIRAESLARYQELMKLANEGKAEQEKHQRFAAGSPDQKKCEDRITKLKAEIEALRENSEREFTQKESETMATIYNEITAMTKSVAKKRGMTFVVKFSDTPASGNEPNSVVAAMSRTVVYSDPSVDITGDVIKYLNYYYRQSGAPAPKNTAMSPPAGQQQVAPQTRPATPAGGN